MTLQTLAVLRVMLETPAGSHYGLEIAKALHLPTGTVYPILYRLEQAGWIVSEFEEAAAADLERPRRRLYTLTGQGAQAARAEIDRGRLAITLENPAQTRIAGSEGAP
jgi:DNA-binding PadR family transcriptional regulator